MGSFSPRSLGNIYVAEAALAEISCQGCGRRFQVALSDAFVERRYGLNDAIRLRRADYGDPPNIGCCATGPTMTSVMHAILEYWCRDEVAQDWVRDPTFEGPVAEGRLEPSDTVAAVLAAVAANKRPDAG